MDYKARKATLARAAAMPPRCESLVAKLRRSGVDVPRYSMLVPLPGDANSESLLGLDWSQIPAAATIQGASLPPDRCARKQLQVENMVMFVKRLIRLHTAREEKKPLRIVEFCSGSASVSLPLAYLYPEHTFFAVDNKMASLSMARRRAEDSGLENFVVKNLCIDEFNHEFDIGVALHACGGLSDVVIDKAMTVQASFLICSCCVGKVVARRQVPSSKTFTDALDGNDFCALIKAADFGHSDLHSYNETERQRRLCKLFVEKDRLLAVDEKDPRGWHTFLAIMQGGETSVKNDLLVGIAPGVVSNREEAGIEGEEMDAEELLFFGGLKG